MNDKKIVRMDRMKEDSVAILEWKGVAKGEDVVQVFLAVGTVVVVDGKEMVEPILDLKGLAIPKKTFDDGLMSKQLVYEFLLQEWLNYRYGMKELGCKKIVKPGERG